MKLNQAFKNIHLSSDSLPRHEFIQGDIRVWRWLAFTSSCAFAETTINLISIPAGLQTPSLLPLDRPSHSNAALFSPKQLLMRPNLPFRRHLQRTYSHPISVAWQYLSFCQYVPLHLYLTSRVSFFSFHQPATTEITSGRDGRGRTPWQRAKDPAWFQTPHFWPSFSNSLLCAAQAQQMLRG